MATCAHVIAASASAAASESQVPRVQRFGGGIPIETTEVHLHQDGDTGGANAYAEVKFSCEHHGYVKAHHDNKPIIKLTGEKVTVESSSAAKKVLLGAHGKNVATAITIFVGNEDLSFDNRHFTVQITCTTSAEAAWSV